MSESSRPFAANLAIVIGINQYQNIEPLSSAQHDAKRLAQILQKQYDYDVELFTDEQATSENIWNYLKKELPQTIEPHNDNGERVRLLFYFAGHGTPPQGEDGEGGYLLPQDAQSGKTDTFLSMKEIHDVLTHLGCHHLLIILDCCYAGAFCFISRDFATAPEELSKERYDNYIKFPAGQVIASAAHDQTAIDILKDNRGTGENSIHSPFAELLFQALEDEKTADYTKDGIKTVRELDLYLGEELPKLTKNRQICRAWCLSAYDKGEFFFQTDQFNRHDLPDAIDLNKDNNPYRGLKSFEEADRRFFFGRCEVLKDLYRRINADDQPLTVVLGISGSGKSSLVKAGLIPIMRDPELRQETFKIEAQQNHQNSSSQTFQTSSEDQTQWRILEPIRPGASPFLTLARAMLPLAFQESDLKLEPLKQLDELLRKARRKEHDNEKLKELFVKWRRTAPEDKLLLIIQHFDRLKELCQDREKSPTLNDLQALREMGLNRSRLVLDNLGELTQYCDAAEKEQLNGFYNKCKTQIQGWSEVWQEDEDGQQFGQQFGEFIAKNCPKDKKIKILLVVDQFEEMITQCKQEERQKLLNALQSALAACRQQFRLVLTLRDDFQHYFENSEQLQSYWKKNACFRVNSMGRDQLREAIEQPAAAQDLYFETKDDKSLVTQLLDDIGDTSGALPLLSFTLSELYYKYVQKGCSDRTLRWKDYEGEDDEALGGVTKAITRKATEVYNDLANDFVDGKAIKVESSEVVQARQTMLRWVMLRMVTLDGREKAKRPVLDDELTYRDTETEQWNKHRELVIDRFVDARLLIKGTNLGGKTYVEPAHDILVREWDKITTWLSEAPEHTNEMQKQPDLKSQNKPWFGLSLPLIRRNNQPEKGQEKFDLNLQRDLTIAANKWNNARQANPVKQNNPAPDTDKSQANGGNKTNGKEQPEKAVLLNRGMILPSPLSTLERTELLKALKTRGLAAFKSISTQPFIFASSNAKEAVGLLWNGHPRLPQAEQIAKSNDNWLNQVEADFVQESSLQRRRNMYLRWGIAGVVTLIISAAWINAQKQLVSTIGALTNNSQELFESNKRFDALLASLNAGKNFQQLAFGANPDLQMRIKDALQNPIIWVKERNRLEGHNGAIDSVSFSPSGQVLASASADGTIKFWDVTTGKVISTLDKNKIKIHSFSFIKDRLLAFDSADGTIKFWNVTTGEVINTLNKSEIGVKGVTFSSNGQVASRSADNTIKLWDVTTGKVFNTLKTDKHGGRGESIIFSPDGQWLASVIGQWENSKDGAIVTIWNVTTGKAINTFKITSDGFIDSLSFSPNGQLLASAGEDQIIHLWDVATGKEIKTFTGHTNRISSVSFSANGQMLASTSWDTTIKFWDVATGEEIKTFTGHKTKLNSLSFSPNGNLLASGSLDGAIKLWDTSPQQEVIPLDSSHLVGDGIVGDGISFSPDRQLLASTQKAVYENQKNLIKLWDVASHKEITILTGHWHWIKSVNFSPDGQWLASAAWDHTIKLWNIRACIETTTCEASETLELPSSQFVESVSFSPNGKLLASAGNVGWGQNNDIQIWDVATRPINSKPIKILQGHKNFIASIRFSPDGKLLASAASDHTIKIWDVDAGIEIKTLEGHRDQVNEVSFSPDGKLLASASNDETIKLWNITTGIEIRTFTEHTGSVSRVIFSPDGKWLVSSSGDNTIKLWDVATGKVTNTLRGQSGIQNLSLSNDGQLLVSQNYEQVLLWNVKVLSDLTFDDLMVRGCNWMRNYLQNNPNENDRHLCDG
jgi:WD40 repeat protein